MAHTIDSKHADHRRARGIKGNAYRVVWHDRHLRKQRSETFRDRRSAERRLKVVQGLLAQGDAAPGPGKVTYGAFYKEWIAEDVDRRQSTKVIGQYTGLQTTLVLPFWQTRPLTAINVDTLIEWVAWMGTKTRSWHTKNEAWVSMSSCLSYAAFKHRPDRPLIDRNPMHGLKKRLLPVKDKPNPKAKIILDPNQILALSEAVDPRYKALVLVLGCHGLRPCEALALTLDDTDLLNGTLRVNKGVINVQGRMVPRDATKNGRERTVHLLSFVTNALIEHIRDYCDATDDKALLFPSHYKNEYIHTDTLRAWIIKPAGERIGIEGLTSYHLRATANNNVIAYTGDHRLAMNMLGNSAAVNLNHYTQSTEASIERGKDLLTQAFGLQANVDHDGDLHHLDVLSTRDGHPNEEGA